MSVAHANHIGIEGCLRRMRECLYWPRMTTQVKDYISKCEVCLSHRSAPPREPLRQHDFVARPWSKIGADLCQIDGRTLLVVCDYFSNLIEVARLNTVTTRSVLRELLPMFARFGLPDVLVTQRATICISRVCRAREAERYFSRDILTTLRTEQRQIWECAEDAETTLCQSQTEWWVRVHGAARVEKYTIRRYENESCSTTHGSTVKNVVTSRWNAVENTLWHRCRYTSIGRQKATSVVLLQPTRTSAYADRRRRNRSYEASGWEDVHGHQERVPSRSTHEVTAWRLAGRSTDAIDDSWCVLARSRTMKRAETMRRHLQNVMIRRFRWVIASLRRTPFRSRQTYCQICVDLCANASHQRGLTTTFRWYLRHETFSCKISSNLMDFLVRGKMDFLVM